MKPVAHFQIVISFRQQISRNEETESYQVEVVRAPGYGWGGPFLPLGLDESHTTALRQLYRSYLERLHTRGETMDEREIEPLRVAGTQLFQALPETVQARLYQTQALAREKGQAVNLVLAFDPSARPLLALPWELLHDPVARNFLGLGGGSLTRRLWLPGAPTLPPDFRPQKIVGVWAEPDGGDRLSTRAQYSPAPGKGKDIFWLTGANSLGQLARTLEAQKGTFDGLHLVAHGRAGEGWRDFSLALANERNQREWISPDRLCGFLAGYPSLRFVYLDVCAAGGSQAEGDMQPGGLAASLLGAGISAVVAMQDNMSQAAAGVTAQTFYTHLAQGVSIPDAMAAARRAVRVTLDDPLHWSVPALYSQQKLEETIRYPTRLADGVLDRITEIVRPEGFVGVATLLLASALSVTFAGLNVGHLGDWRELAVPVALSILFVIVGAGSMRTGQRALGEEFHLNGRGWLEVLLHKYTGAAVWGFGWWSLIWAAGLVGTWLGVGELFGATATRVGWGLGLVGLTGAGYVGARQAIRQSRLFMRLGKSRRFGQDVFLFLVMPLIPVFLAWLIEASWAILTESWWGLMSIVGMCFALAWMVRGTTEGYSEEK